MLRISHVIPFALLTATSLAVSPLCAEETLEELEERAMQAAVAKVSPSVVRIETFGGLEKVDKLVVGTGPTTGLVVSSDGYIVSSAFNFVQQPASILVSLPGGKRAAAQIVARDRSRMIVLLKIKTEEPLVVPAAVPRSEMTVGQWTIAIGRTFEADQLNMSVGVMSATNRVWGKAVQTDAKISPGNYGGPLVDIRGRVLGVLAPLSPQAKGELAGAEWYDSGIGFAVPLDDINRRLDTLKSGKDLHEGLLGVSLKGTDIYDDPAEIAACPANTPAAKAGLKPGDKIVEIDGAQIERQAQLRHALGARYAGDTVRVAALRGSERIEASIELTDKIEPFQHPFLGVLPARDSKAGGVSIRYVYPGSPAAGLGIVAGDRITDLSGKPIKDAGTLQDVVATQELKKKVPLKFEHGGQPREAEVEFAVLPTAVPDKLPPPRTARPAAAAERPPVGTVSIKLPEETGDCLAYIPENYHPDVACGVVLWLHASGGYENEKLVAHWKALCDENDLILLAPKSADPAKWQPTDAAFVRKVADDLIGKYNVDRSRIVAYGYQGGGAMAYLAAFAHRDLIRGVAAVDAALPGRSQPPATDPVFRLAVYSAAAEKSAVAEGVKATVKRLADLKFPVTAKTLSAPGRDLTEEELAELVRWIDSLDRI